MTSEPVHSGGAHQDDEVAGLRAELAEAEAEAEAAEAEAAEAEARAQAGLARSRAAAQPEQVPARSAKWRHGVGLAVIALVAGACLALTGLMVVQHGRVAARHALDGCFVAAARDGVAALLSIDHSNAQADVQRVLDLSAGQFHEDFQKSAEDFVRTAVDSRAVTEAKITAAALDSGRDDRATVLVAATSQVTNANGADQDRRPFRISVTVLRDGDTCKMSDVEFVA